MPAATSGEPGLTQAWRVRDYALGATLGSGQAFRWYPDADAWTGVVAGRWIRLRSTEADDGIVEVTATLAEPVTDWTWLERYLAIDENLGAILGTFPDDEPMRAAVAACRGLRLLRQEPWECLASFICSSTKQIVQIQEIVRLLSQRCGTPVKVPEGTLPQAAFPGPTAVASVGEAALRACKLGFRAPYVLEAARRIDRGELDLEAIRRLDTPGARAALTALPGVGRKIADCVLLFAYGRPDAFPVDVWIQKALARLYFPRARRVTSKRLLQFSETHFGPHGGYAQQYLFHYARTVLGRAWASGADTAD
jgi:N-glycosylase/DNA lyase